MDDLGLNPNKYRVELAMSGRAGCVDGQCKAEGKKIPKGELRFGSWVTLGGGEHGSFKWKHWGCVSGAQVQSAKEEIMRDGVMDFGYLDGYDELEDAGLQEKVRRCFEQGHIDPEDFNGDPEYNVPGKRGIRGRKRKAAEEDSEDDQDASPVKKPKQSVTKESQRDEDGKTSGKRAKKLKAPDIAEDEDGGLAKPTKKAKALKAAKDEPDELAKPAKKARAFKTVKEESEEPVGPTKKAKATKAIKDEPDEPDELGQLGEPIKLPKKQRQSKNLKKEVTEAEDGEPKVMANTKAKRRPKVDEEKMPIRGYKGRKSSEEIPIKNEDASEDEPTAPLAGAGAKKQRSTKANKEVERAVAAKPVKGGRAKKTAAPTDGAEEPPAPAAKRGKGRKKAAAEDDEEAEPAVVNPARAKGRKKTSKPQAQPDPEHDEMDIDEEEAPPPARPRRRRAAA